MDRIGENSTAVLYYTVPSLVQHTSDHRGASGRYAVCGCKENAEVALRETQVRVLLRYPKLTS